MNIKIILLGLLVLVSSISIYAYPRWSMKVVNNSYEQIHVRVSPAIEDVMQGDPYLSDCSDITSGASASLQGVELAPVQLNDHSSAFYWTVKFNKGAHCDGHLGHLNLFIWDDTQQPDLASWTDRNGIDFGYSGDDGSVLQRNENPCVNMRDTNHLMTCYGSASAKSFSTNLNTQLYIDPSNLHDVVLMVNSVLDFGLI